MSKKAIHFDLSTSALKKHFDNTAEAYNQIKTFMLANGFEHYQYSGYMSKKTLSNDSIFSLAKKLFKTFPWLHQCAQKFSFSNVPQEYDLLEMMHASKDRKNMQLETKSRARKNRQ